MRHEIGFKFLLGFYKNILFYVNGRPSKFWFYKSKVLWMFFFGWICIKFLILEEYVNYFPVHLTYCFKSTSIAHHQSFIFYGIIFAVTCLFDTVKWKESDFSTIRLTFEVHTVYLLGLPQVRTAQKDEKLGAISLTLIPQFPPWWSPIRYKSTKRVPDESC